MTNLSNLRNAAYGSKLMNYFFNFIESEISPAPHCDGGNEETTEDWRKRTQSELSEFASDHFDDFHATPFDCEWPQLQHLNGNPKVVGLIHPDHVFAVREYNEAFRDLVFKRIKTTQFCDDTEYIDETVYVVFAQ